MNYLTLGSFKLQLTLVRHCKHVAYEVTSQFVIRSSFISSILSCLCELFFGLL